MASPQWENGYTKIANELLEALCRVRISGEARQVLDVVIRKTYGYNKKEDRIALSQLCFGTGLKKSTVCKAIVKLQVMNLITKKDNGEGNIFKFNKDYSSWKPLPKKVTLPKKVMGGTPKRKQGVPKKETYKRNYTKETNTKEIVSKETRELKAPNPHITELVDYLKSKLGGRLDGSEKTNRRYAYLALKKFNKDPLQALEVCKRLIDVALKDSFHAKNMTEIKYIYYNGLKIYQSSKLGKYKPKMV